MTDINLDALSLSELRQLEKSVARAISSFEGRRKAEARAKVDELARELGFSLEDLVVAAPSRKRSASVPKCWVWLNPGKRARTSRDRSGGRRLTVASVTRRLSAGIPSA